MVIIDLVEGLRSLYPSEHLSDTQVIRRGLFCNRLYDIEDEVRIENGIPLFFKEERRWTGTVNSSC